MLERALEQEVPTSLTIRKHPAKTGDLIYNFMGLLVLPLIVALMKPFAEVTKFACLEQNTSASYVLPMLHSLRTIHTQVNDSDSDVIKKMKNILAQQLKSRWTETLECCLMISTILDPR